MSKALNIFLVSAADNLDTLSSVQAELAAHGHNVQGRAHHARAMHARRDCGGMLLGEEDQLFSELALQIGMADLFVLVPPDDHDVACLAGMAHVSGVPVAVIGINPQCGFMVKGCVSFWLETVDGLLEMLTQWSEQGVIPGEDA